MRGKLDSVTAPLSLPEGIHREQDNLHSDRETRPCVTQEDRSTVMLQQPTAAFAAAVLRRHSAVITNMLKIATVL